jgi:hypothetical protein
LKYRAGEAGRRKGHSEIKRGAVAGQAGEREVKASVRLPAYVMAASTTWSSARYGIPIAASPSDWPSQHSVEHCASPVAERAFVQFAHAQDRSCFHAAPGDACELLTARLAIQKCWFERHAAHTADP